MTDINETIKNIGSDSILFAHKAFLFLEDKKVDEALDLCEAGVKRFPFYAEGHFILGKCYQARQKYDAAKDEYERTLIYMPGHIRAFNALSFIYHKKNLPAKGNDLLLLAAVHNPFNIDLINYLKNEEIYDLLYPGADTSESQPLTEEQIPTAKEEIPSSEEVTGKDELTSEIEDVVPKGDDETGISDAETELAEWERDADQIKAEDLLPFNLSEKNIEDSTIRFGDSEIIDFENDRGSELEEKLSKAEIKDTEEKQDQVVWEPDAEEDMPEKDNFDTDINDIPIQDSDLDESYLLDENENDDFFLGSESSEESIKTKDKDATKIDDYASSKDEITELSIEQYEVNSIVDNIIESDKKDTTKPDLSKFANIDDDFSTLMDGIFERKKDLTDDELLEDDFGETSEGENLDDAEMAEERPILDTSIIFPERNKADIESVDDTSELSDLNAEEDQSDDVEFDLPEPDTDFVEEEDEITRVIEQIEKAGERPRKIGQSKTKSADESALDEADEILPLNDENVNIDEILANPKMLTPTFGEILIAQKKFEDARRVFTELSKRDPDNQRLVRKIDFLDKLVQFKK